MKSTLLCGCGNIGFRHLQAIAAARTPMAVTVVEPDVGQHDRIRSEFESAAASPHTFELDSSLPSSGSFDLVVVATAAEQRREVVEHVLDHSSVNVILLEKVLFQRSSDLDVVGERLEAAGVAAFVNCGRRTFPGYQALRADLSGSQPTHVTVRGQRLGLASNGVHFLDLAEFLNDAEIVDIDASGLVPGAVPAKRAGCVEVFGSIEARLDNGAALRGESMDTDPIRVEVHVAGPTGTYVIDELERTVVFDDGPAQGFVSQNVSETTEIYDQAVSSRWCDLTPYEDSARQHRFFLGAIRSHLGLPDTDDQPCPIS